MRGSDRARLAGVDQRGLARRPQRDGCSPGIRDDVRAAGAIYSDEAVVIDGNLITGRGGDDLPAFVRSMMLTLAKVRV